MPGQDMLVQDMFAQDKLKHNMLVQRVFRATAWLKLPQRLHLIQHVCCVRGCRRLTCSTDSAAARSTAICQSVDSPQGDLDDILLI